MSVEFLSESPVFDRTASVTDAVVVGLKKVHRRQREHFTAVAHPAQHIDPRLLEHQRRPRAERAEKSGRECKPASRVQGTQANDDWLREGVTGEYLPKWHPVNGRPLCRRVTPSAVGQP